MDVPARWGLPASMGHVVQLVLRAYKGSGESPVPRAHKGNGVPKGHRVLRVLREKRVTRGTVVMLDHRAQLVQRVGMVLLPNRPRTDCRWSTRRGYWLRFSPRRSNMTDETFVNLAPRELEEDQYSYWIQLCLALDCFLNAALGGWHHETLSSRSWRAWKMRRGFGLVFRPLIDVMFIWQSWSLDHCKRHHEAEVARAAEIVSKRKLWDSI